MSNYHGFNPGRESIFYRKLTLTTCDSVQTIDFLQKWKGLLSLSRTQWQLGRHDKRGFGGK
jgi:hypothetical protein